MVRISLSRFQGCTQFSDNVRVDANVVMEENETEALWCNKWLWAAV